jgi:hypothetical protein
MEKNYLSLVIVYSALFSNVLKLLVAEIQLPGNVISLLPNTKVLYKVLH